MRIKKSPRMENQTQTRLACDRCHYRKLRCLRDVSMAECSRCIQDGFSCTYSPPLKSGRPKKACRRTVQNLDPAPSTDPFPSPNDSSLYSSSTNSTTIPSPLPYLSQSDANLEGVNDQIFMSLDIDLLAQVDAARMTPSTGTRSPDCFMCPDLLRNDEEQPYFHGHQNNSGNKNLERLRGNSSRGVEWGSGFDGLGSNVPHESSVLNQMAWSPSSTQRSSIPEIMQSLPRLQQELVQYGSPLPESYSNTTNSSRQGAANTVDAILRPGQELLDTVRQLFDECSKNRQNGIHTYDHQTIILLVLTPLSLLLSAYSKVLWEITTTRQSQPDHNPSSYFRPLTAQPPTLGAGDNLRQDDPSVSCLPRSDCVDFLPEESNLTLGEMSLDRPLQLVVVTTVIKHHLTYLEHALQVYQSERKQCARKRGISEGLFSTTITELRSSMKVLISEATDLL